MLCCFLYAPAGRASGVNAFPPFNRGGSLHAAIAITMLNVPVYLDGWSQRTSSNLLSQIEHKKSTFCHPQTSLALTPNDNLWRYYLANCLHTLATIFNLIFPVRLLSLMSAWWKIYETKSHFQLCLLNRYSHTTKYLCWSAFERRNKAEKRLLLFLCLTLRKVMLRSGEFNVG